MQPWARDLHEPGVDGQLDGRVLQLPGQLLQPAGAPAGGGGDGDDVVAAVLHDAGDGVEVAHHRHVRDRALGARGGAGGGDGPPEERVATGAADQVADAVRGADGQHGELAAAPATLAVQELAQAVAG